MIVSDLGLLLYGSPVSMPSTKMLGGSIVHAGAEGVGVEAVDDVVAAGTSHVAVSISDLGMT